MAPGTYMWIPRIISVIAMLAAHSHAVSSENTKKALNLINVDKKSLAGLLARSCSKSGWQEFLRWTTLPEFNSLQLNDSYEIVPSMSGLRVEGETGVETRIRGSSLEIVANDHVFSGEDGCTALMQFVQRESGPQVAGALIGAALIGSAKLTAAGPSPDFSGASAAIFLALDAGKRKPGLQFDLVKILDSNFNVRCGEASATIQTSTHKVVVQRNGGKLSAFDVFDRENGISVTLERGSWFTKTLREYFGNATKNCRSMKEGEEIAHAATDALEEAISQAATIRNGGPRVPASK